MKFLLLAAGASVVAAKCANDCSNHGDCNAKNQCECHRNYFGSDCSERLCAAGRAFIDSAVGDVNGDNAVSVDLVFAQGRAVTPISEVFSYQYGAARDSSDVTRSWNEAHFYQECSSKGVCDTATGECLCFPGYEGSGCARKACVSDCAGHGACKNYAGTAYNMWDADATLYCDCDAGYTGPGCELRVCPSGVDPVQAANLDTSRLYQIGFKTLSVGVGDFTAETFYQVPFGPVTWTITLTDEYGDEWTTSLITVNYDVVIDDDGDADVVDVPLFSLPIIAAGTETAGGANLVDSDATSQLQISVDFNEFGDGNLHVADQVKDALEALPNHASGAVVVHEIYTLPSLPAVVTAANLLSSQFPAPFTGGVTGTLAWPGICGRYDIYLTPEDIAADGAAVAQSYPSIAGCGVAVVDTELGAGTCAGRSGNQDIEDYLGNAGFYAGGLFTGLVHDNDPLVITDVGPGDDEAVQSLADLTDVAAVQPGTADGIFLLTGHGDPDVHTHIYYQYPHFSNGDGAEARFPLFIDLAADCATPGDFYGAGRSYHYDMLKLSDNSVPGLSLFVYFQESTIETAPRVDYTFNNQAADVFLSTTLFNSEVRGIGIGETVEGVSGGEGQYASHSLVEVVDRGGDRVWDVAYHGRQAYFLEDGSATSDGVKNHMCSKRGLCDYSTGLCDCFEGFTGANCAEQNALAY